MVEEAGASLEAVAVLMEAAGASLEAMVLKAWEAKASLGDACLLGEALYKAREFDSVEW